jgi:hypothetical protein
MNKNQECIGCDRRDPVQGKTCEICETFFCGACAETELREPTIDDVVLDILVCTEHTDAEIIEHLEAERNAQCQKLIDSGDAWRLEGSVGRHCMDLIEAGICMLGPERTTGAYGNIVPSRFDVKPGTKGSPEYQEKMLS